MDIREVQQLEGVKIIDPKASRNRQIVVAALTVAAIGVLGWIIFGQPATKPAAAPPASVATPAAPAAPPASAPVAAAESTARQATGTIAESAKPLPAIRLATPQQAAAAPASNPSADPTPSPSADPTSSPSADPTSSPASSPSPSLAGGAPASAPAASAPALKLDTEFASAKRIVPFAFNKVGVGPLGRLAVKELAPLAKQADKVNVRGRTDGRGTAAANRKVALDRARTVYNAFAQEGVDRQKMRLGYCTTCFVAPNDTEAGRRLNRRVEVELIMPSEQIAKLPKPVYASESLPPLATSAALRKIPR